MAQQPTKGSGPAAGSAEPDSGAKPPAAAHRAGRYRWVLASLASIGLLALGLLGGILIGQQMWQPPAAEHAESTHITIERPSGPRLRLPEHVRDRMKEHLQRRDQSVD